MVQERGRRNAHGGEVACHAAADGRGPHGALNFYKKTARRGRASRRDPYLSAQRSLSANVRRAR
jgi:hypothetical protein